MLSDDLGMRVTGTPGFSLGMLAALFCLFRFVLRLADSLKCLRFEVIVPMVSFIALCCRIHLLRKLLCLGSRGVHDAQLPLWMWA